MSDYFIKRVSNGSIPKDSIRRIPFTNITNTEEQINKSRHDSIEHQDESSTNNLNFLKIEEKEPKIPCLNSMRNKFQNSFKNEKFVKYDMNNSSVLNHSIFRSPKISGSYLMKDKYHYNYNPNKLVNKKFNGSNYYNNENEETIKRYEFEDTNDNKRAPSEPINCSNSNINNNKKFKYYQYKQIQQVEDKSNFNITNVNEDKMFDREQRKALLASCLEIGDEFNKDFQEKCQQQINIESVVEKETVRTDFIIIDEPEKTFVYDIFNKNNPKYQTLPTEYHINKICSNKNKQVDNDSVVIIEELSQKKQSLSQKPKYCRPKQPKSSANFSSKYQNSILNSFAEQIRKRSNSRKLQDIINGASKSHRIEKVGYQTINDSFAMLNESKSLREDALLPQNLHTINNKSSNKKTFDNKQQDISLEKERNKKLFEKKTGKKLIELLQDKKTTRTNIMVDSRVDFTNDDQSRHYMSYTRKNLNLKTKRESNFKTINLTTKHNDHLQTSPKIKKQTYLGGYLLNDKEDDCKIDTTKKAPTAINNLNVIENFNQKNSAGKNLNNNCSTCNSAYAQQPQQQEQNQNLKRRTGSLENYILNSRGSSENLKELKKLTLNYNIHQSKNQFEGTRKNFGATNKSMRSDTSKKSLIKNSLRNSPNNLKESYPDKVHPQNEFFNEGSLQMQHNNKSNKRKLSIKWMTPTAIEYINEKETQQQQINEATNDEDNDIIISVNNYNDGVSTCDNNNIGRDSKKSSNNRLNQKYSNGKHSKNISTSNVTGGVNKCDEGSNAIKSQSMTRKLELSKKIKDYKLQYHNQHQDTPPCYDVPIELSEGKGFLEKKHSSKSRAVFVENQKNRVRKDFDFPVCNHLKSKSKLCDSVGINNQYAPKNEKKKDGSIDLSIILNYSTTIEYQQNSGANTVKTGNKQILKRKASAGVNLQDFNQANSEYNMLFYTDNNCQKNNSKNFQHQQQAFANNKENFLELKKKKKKYSKISNLNNIFDGLTKLNTVKSDGKLSKASLQNHHQQHQLSHQQQNCMNKNLGLKRDEQSIRSNIRKALRE